MKAEAVEALKKDLIVIGGSAGKVAGEKAGTEAGSKINIPKILTEAIAAAVEAAKKAAKLGQASEQVKDYKLETSPSSILILLVNNKKCIGGSPCLVVME